MTVTAHYAAPDASSVTGVSEESIEGLLRQGTGVLWVDVAGAEHIPLLIDTFGFHPLTLKAVAEPGTHPARLEAFDGYSCLVAHGLAIDSPLKIVEIMEVTIFVGAHYVVTVHAAELPCLTRLLDRVLTDEHLLRHGPTRLTLEFLEELIIDTRSIIETLDDVADDYEVLVVDSPNKDMLRKILVLKRSAVHIERMMDQQIDMIEQFGQSQAPADGDDAKIARDLFSRSERLRNASSILLERANNLLMLYLNSLAIKQNETMKTLALVAAIFLPLTLIAAIYGMNFDNMPELSVS